MASNSRQQKLHQAIKERQGEIAQKWFQEIASMSNSPYDVELDQAQFREMTSHVISLLFHTDFDPERAQGIGVSLAKSHYIQPEVLGLSQKILTQLLLEGLSLDLFRSIHPRLTIVLSEMATGFISETRRIILEEQENIRSALVSEIQSSDTALRDLNEELDRRFKERTTELALSNEELINEIAEHKLTQTTLRESEEKWRSLVKNAPERIITLAPDGTILFINRTFPTRTPEEVIGTNFFDWVTPEIKPIVEQALESVFIRRKPTRYSVDFPNHEGEMVTFENSMSPVIHGENVIEAILISTDITEREKATKALRESEKNFSALAENAHDGILITTFEGNYIYSNQRFSEISGYQPDELQKINLVDLSTDEYKEMHSKWSQQRYEGNYLSRQFETKFITKQGKTVQIETTTAVTTWKGKPASLAIVRDITERKRVLQALRESEKNFSALAENAYDGIVIVSFEGELIYFNKRLTEITGFSVEELAVMNLLDITPTEESNKYQNWLMERQHGEIKSPQFESVFKKKDNGNVPIEMTTSETTWKGQPALLGVVRDITERKNTEQSLKQRSGEIAQLHEQLKFRRVEEQTALLNLSQSLLGETDRQKVFVLATSALHELFRADYCEILLLNDNNKSLQFAAGCGWHFNIDEELEIPTGLKSLAGFTLEAKQPIIVKDISQETRFTPSTYYVNHGIMSSVSVPMKVQDRIIGVMGIHWDHLRKIREGEVRILPLIANTTSAALEGVRLFEDVQQRSQSLNRTNELITALSQTGTRLAITLDPDQVMGTVRTELNKIGFSCAAFLYEEDELEIGSLYSALEPGMLEQTKKNTGIDLHDPQLLQQFLKKFFGDILNTNQPKYIKQQIIDRIVENTHPDKSNIEAALSLVGLSPETPSMWLPLIVKNHVMGTLGLWGEGLEQEDLPAVNVFASQVATALENAQLFDQIVDSRKRMRDLSSQMVQVQETERRRIARELHDEIGQSLTGLSLMLNSLYSPDEKKSEYYQKTQSLVEELIGKTQDLSLDLRPAMLDEMGLLPTLLWFFHRYEMQTSIHINFEHKGLNQRFSSPLETTVYRILQEALTNIARHAGVKHAEVRVWADQKSVSIQIEDQGLGFNLEDKHADGAANGLIGMNERVTLLGGELDLTSTPGVGTTMYATLPVHYDDQGEPYDL